MGVTHGDLLLHNILVSVQNNDHLEVYLMGFHLARLNPTQEDIKADEKQVLSLATVIVLSLNEDSERWIYERRSQLLSHVNQHLTLVEIAILVCGLLYDYTPEDKQ